MTQGTEIVRSSRTLFRHDVDHRVSVGFHYDHVLGQLVWAFAFQNPKDNFNKKIARKIIEGRLMNQDNHYRRMTRDQWESIRKKVTDEFFRLSNGWRRGGGWSHRYVMGRTTLSSIDMPKEIEKFINSLDLGGDSPVKQPQDERPVTPEAPHPFCGVVHLGYFRGEMCKMCGEVVK